MHLLCAFILGQVCPRSRVAHCGEMYPSSGRHMCTSNIRIPYRVAHGLTIGESDLTNDINKLATYFELVLVAFSASNIADLARSKTCLWRPDPPLTFGSKSFSPRLGITGRATELYRRGASIIKDPCELRRTIHTAVWSNPGLRLHLLTIGRRRPLVFLRRAYF